MSAPQQEKEEQTKAISVVIPVYLSADIFPELYKRLIATLEKTAASFEIVAVADGNADGAADVIAAIHKNDQRVKLLELSRNFGHQVAVSAGLEHATGQMIVIMDDDLEDPPEVIPQLIAKANEGFDLVYGIRRRRKVSIIKRVAYAAFYRLINSLSAIDIPYDSGDFCLMTRPIVDALNRMPEKNRFIRGLRCWAGYRQTGLVYERDARFSGESSYSMRGYFKFAMDGILSFSYRPLTVVSLIGFLSASTGFIYAIWAIYSRLTGQMPQEVAGWTSLMVGILFLGGVQLLSIGIIGQYIARIYDEVKQRPHYLMKRALGIQHQHSNQKARHDS